MSRVFGLVSCAHATAHFIFVTALMGRKLPPFDGDGCLEK